MHVILIQQSIHLKKYNNPPSNADEIPKFGYDLSFYG